MRYWNESLGGMTQCCSPNDPYVDGMMTVDMAAIGGMMASCAKEKGGVKGNEGYSYKSGLGAAHSKDEDEASASSRIPPVGRTTLLGVGVWALLAIGLLV
ncbi:hypothetical protein QBC32DRAFT_353804 [Pseudoneurospora amorphoporcata]|uniref:Uncharacterized protein n=1 Tax=Pseudoneurospora amorphoporcata TaxID=241081 RepID=A0AAN6NKP3_9PEZI|nr:hypothetical protein QBC32DRAFT_353804 [Pseudoneurospora amorphoporcata]